MVKVPDMGEKNKDFWSGRRASPDFKHMIIFPCFKRKGLLRHSNMHVNRSALKSASSQVWKCFLLPKEWDLGTFISPWHPEGAERATSISEFKRVIFVPSPSSEGSSTSAVSNSQLKPRATRSPAEQSWAYFIPSWCQTQNPQRGWKKV